MSLHFETYFIILNVKDDSLLAVFSFSTGKTLYLVNISHTDLKSLVSALKSKAYLAVFVCGSGL